ncbi:hypothetical protein [Paradevosia shaoguanensis]|uniref:ParB/Sulfiredoxin domain-containing protein n=1 Tax=Paradevosia shaoguanensis TaxID=1335043 RepID=A0AA41QR27_9HYPH|nr:hypothetical protein [Paradevosia shaoguanensis]MCF1744657.1 hypothetical protein [Paradevosia shaoguanensis]MCI0129140.1 hypothetical protein [Paradevosia shaoguanensis]
MNAHISPINVDTSGASLVRLRCDSINASDRLRRVLPDRVETFRELYRLQGQIVPIECEMRSDGPHRLIHGAHRLAGIMAEGDTEVMALLYPEGHFGSEDEIRAREIAENVGRFPLNALEFAVSLAEWRDIYERQNRTAKPGRKRKQPVTDELMEEMSAEFALNFSEVAQRTLDISRRSVFNALKIATIAPAVRSAIAVHAVAGKQSDLLSLAGQHADRQQRIADLLLAGAALDVAGAIAVIDNIPAPPAPPQKWEALSQTFARLKTADQERFFELHQDAILRWVAGRTN